MFENGEATDVVNENHKGNAPRRVSQQIKQFVWMWRAFWPFWWALLVRYQPPQPSKLQASPEARRAYKQFAWMWRDAEGRSAGSPPDRRK